MSHGLRRKFQGFQGKRRRKRNTASLGIGKAPLSGSVKLSSESVEFTAVGEEGVIKEGGKDNLAVRGGGIGRARGEGCGRGMEACSRCSR